jgi:hypothetical protein
MHAWIVSRGRQVEYLRRQPADRAQHCIGSDHAVVLRGDERDPGVDQRLLRVEHVERGSLSDGGLPANAGERNFRRGHLRLRRRDRRLAGLELAPRGNGVGAGLITDQFEIETLLRQVLLRLADQRIFGATPIDRRRHLRDGGGPR